jgi:Flp pilus assembly protein protease CpaA
MIFAVISFTIAIQYMIYCSYTDVKRRTINWKISAILFYVGLGLALGESLLDPRYFLAWIMGLIFVVPLAYYFFKIGHEKDEFGGGDFFMLITLQALFPSFPIPGATLLIYAGSAVLVWIFSKFKKNPEGYPLAPFLLISMLIFTLIV